MASSSPFVLIARAFKIKIQPSLVAIYAPYSNRPNIVEQVGTGFLVKHNGRAVVITAMHTLYGSSGAEDPGEKSFHWDGQLHCVDAVARVIAQEKDYDIAAFYADELATKPQLNETSIVWRDPLPPYITIGGYLAKDFKRSGDTLAPKPSIHTDQRMKPAKNLELVTKLVEVKGLNASDDLGLVAVRYTKRRNKNSFTGVRIPAAPKPSGLSGGPMISTLTLFGPEPAIVGVFAAQGYGQGAGANAKVIRQLLSAL
ncbi:hypothetical protein VPK21_001365 (plasmid) [Sinorhizobium kummerowiae]|uniref:Serine protease n=1 Tax=Sinorhizobium kummerowiae TaxID=158892 RepID=A0ABY8TFK2_9HYPH|nr:MULTISPECIES: hypothetical protein [Sinorhizobium]RVN89004.1 hypothetical protein CN105_16400 [Sinorhizobium meliloti]WHS96620.1 hypothetical protein PZL22_005556 [Sinorhizobium kummerowiae]WQH41443.1 hypothetical protein VPK21_001365 [Sinorhizobium kummerowiae]